MKEIYYAQIREFSYGLDWTEFGDDNGEEIIVYETKEQADADLREYIKDVNEAYKDGFMDEPYQDDIHIFPVTVEDGYASCPEVDTKAKVFMETYRVKAVFKNYCHIDVKAMSVEHANHIAYNTDGGDFIDDGSEGWQILTDETEIFNEEE